MLTRMQGEIDQIINLSKGQQTTRIKVKKTDEEYSDIVKEQRKRSFERYREFRDKLYDEMNAEMEVFEDEIVPSFKSRGIIWP